MEHFTSAVCFALYMVVDSCYIFFSAGTGVLSTHWWYERNVMYSVLKAQQE